MASGSLGGALASHGHAVITRGIREQVLFKRATELRHLADRLIYALTSKSAATDYALSTQEEHDWAALTTFILRVLPDSRPPYLIDDDSLAVIIGRLKNDDAVHAEYAGSLANLVIFAHILLACRDAAQLGRKPSAEVAADLVAAASTVAKLYAPFHLVGRKDVTVSLLLGLRTHAILVAPEHERLDYVDSLFGDGSTYPAFCEGMWRTAAGVRRRELLGQTREHLQTTYPFDETLETGLDYARSILSLLQDPAAETLPPVPAASAHPPPVPAQPSQQTPHSVDNQIAALFASSTHGSGTSSAPPTSIDPRNNLPILNPPAHRALHDLDPAVLESFLSSIERIYSPGGTERYHLGGVQPATTAPPVASTSAVPAIDIAIDPDLGVGAAGTRLRFGPTSVHLALPRRPFNLARSSLFDPQSDAERIVFDSQAPSSAVGKKRASSATSGDAKGKKRQKSVGGSATPGEGEGSDDDEDEGDSGGGKKVNKRELGQLNRVGWSEEEEALLRAELEVYYDQTECWARIMRRHGPSGEVSRTFKHRTNVGLKDKARNMRMNFERRKEEVPVWLSGVSGLRKRALQTRIRPSDNRVPRPLAPADALRQRKQLENALPTQESEMYRLDPGVEIEMDMDGGGVALGAYMPEMQYAGA